MFPERLPLKTSRLTFFGMSGVGKSHLSSMLREAGWFHYSVDYRIGTRYLGEHIADDFKREAMKVPLLRELLLSDSVYIASNITFNNLAPLTSFLGAPGDPAKSGRSFEEYLRRQRLHEEAEIASMLDVPHFIERAKDLYGYTHFVCDCSGSLCEVVDPDDPADPVLRTLAEHTALIHIRGDEAHEEELARRFAKAPKPMYYREAFLLECWEAYKAERNLREDEVDPMDFVHWGYRELLRQRVPRYRAIARNWGYEISAADIAGVHSHQALYEVLRERAV